jgi:tRNA (cmo5U34)-methyltransferase
MEQLQRSFHDPAVAAAYAENTARKVPGLADLHRMAMLLLAEQAPAEARVLVLGAGGGLELKALVAAQPGWLLTGVDPSAEMLAAAETLLGPLASRVDLQRGYIDTASPGPFDGATCLLTLHFLEREERLRTLREVHRRLKPGARLVVAHHSSPHEGELGRWLARSIAFAASPDSDRRSTTSSVETMERLPVLSVEDDEALLHEAGFADIRLFYAAFTFRGWVATA